MIRQQHSSIGNSVGGYHGALVISLSKLKEIKYDPVSHHVTIQTGNALGEVDDKLVQWGRAIPHGTCPTVGVGGHSGGLLYYLFYFDRCH